MIWSWLRTALREPLTHFLIAGIILSFLMVRFGDATGSDRSITLNEAKIGNIASQWEQTWRRPPSPAELDGLIRDYIKEEIYFREAMRLGLDADDPVIRRRLRTKMEFLATAQVENESPTYAQLQRFHNANRARYSATASFSFEQKFFADDRMAARKAIVALNTGSPVIAVPIGIPASMQLADADKIGRTFGNEFAKGLAKLKPHVWGGPVQSGFGWHAVKIQDVKVSKISPLAEVRQQVTNDWRAETRESREAASYQTLLDSYDISIAAP